MLKRAFFGLLSFLFFLSISLIRPATVTAWPLSFVYGEDENKMLEEYCKRRQGDQMNLETWFSGKCGGEIGQRIGFADMIRLDFDTKLGWSGTVDNNTGEISEARPDLMFAPFGTLLATTYSYRPVALSQYLSYVSKNIKDKHLVEPAYAQTGFGFQSLGPVLEIWRAFRNLAYLAFVLAFVIYGFMIMFRMKINPQTVANIQSSIPKLVTTLLIITFSFAIAGFIIDLTYLVQELVVNAVFSNTSSTGSIAFKFFGINIASVGIDLGSTIPKIFIGSHGGLMAPLMYMLMAISIGGVIPRIMSILTPSFGVAWVDEGLRAMTNNPLINFIVGLVIVIAVFYTFFKISFALIKAFTITIIQVIFSPIILLGDIFPGSNSFGNWWRTIVANMAAFPATIVCFLLSFIFLGPLVFDPNNVRGGILGLTSFLGMKFTGELDLYGLANLTSNPLIIPPPLGINIGNMSGVRADAMMAFVGLGIFMMTPKLVEMIQEALKVPAFKYGTALTEALQFGWKPVGFAANQAKGQGASYLHGVSQTSYESKMAAAGYTRDQGSATGWSSGGIGGAPVGQADINRIAGGYQAASQVISSTLGSSGGKSELKK